MKTAEKSKTAISPEFEFFLKNPLTKYEGTHVAILGKKVVASGKTAKEAWDKARKKYPGKIPLLAKIPRQEALVLL